MSEMHLDLTDLLDQDISSFEYFQSLSGKQRKRLMDMDIRSFDLNFEVNAFMYDAGITKILEDDFLKDLHSSVEITKEWYRRRKWWFKVREAIARLISPML